MSRKLAQDYFEGLSSFGIKPGLENIVAVLDRLGNPQEQLQVIHIAGTNGKGSVTEYTHNILSEGGYKVGTFTSPHLVELYERIRINAKNITEDDFWSYMDRVREANRETIQEGYRELGYFEALTVVAFLYFLEKKVDFMVLEVGIGGRLDATNVISQPLVSVITKIAMDHKEILGDTLSQIAREKAGIIKEKGEVIIPTQEKEVMRVFEKVCKQKKATLTWVDLERVEKVQVGEKGTCFQMEGEDYALQMLGIHQAYNASIAKKIIELLKKQGKISLSQEQLKQGMYKTKWPGRFEKVMDSPEFYVDGAHNVDGMKALEQTLGFLKPCYTIGVVTILKDKEIGKMLELIAHRFDDLIVTLPQNKRAASLEELVTQVRNYHHKVHTCLKVEEALKYAIELTNESHEPKRIVAFGSLYMIGEIYTLLKRSKISKSEDL